MPYAFSGLLHTTWPVPVTTMWPPSVRPSPTSIVPSVFALRSFRQVSEIGLRRGVIGPRATLPPCSCLKTASSLSRYSGSGQQTSLKISACNARHYWLLFPSGSSGAKCNLVHTSFRPLIFCCSYRSACLRISMNSPVCTMQQMVSQEKQRMRSCPCKRCAAFFQTPSVPRCGEGFYAGAHMLICNYSTTAPYMQLA